MEKLTLIIKLEKLIFFINCQPTELESCSNPLKQGWGTYLLSLAAWTMDYLWQAANNRRLYPKIVPLSYCKG